MSDATSLSSTYSVTSDFAKKFNGAVLILKRSHLAPDSLPRPTADEESEARDQIAGGLRGVVAELDGAAMPDSPMAARVPAGVISWLTEKKKSQMTWFLKDLRAVTQLLTGAAALGSDEFSTLDEVCDAADATASASFRRLWRR